VILIGVILLYNVIYKQFILDYLVTIAARDPPSHYEAIGLMHKKDIEFENYRQRRPTLIKTERYGTINSLVAKIRKLPSQSLHPSLITDILKLSNSVTVEELESALDT
jgi:hypothetical protein